MVRRERYYSGRVQGVGFRYTVQCVAQRFGLAGYVENLRDGRVHLVIDGEQNQIDDFSQALADEMQSYIRRVEETTPEDDERFDGFEIRR